MGVITEDAVRRLAGFKRRPADVVSVYLDVDGRRHPRRKGYEAALDQLLRPIRADARPDVVRDLDRITAHVRAGIDRSHTRGLVVFACGDALWETLELNVPVRDEVVVDHSPRVRQLEAVIRNHERFGVLVVDRQRARMFVFEQGELVDHTERDDALPRHDDDGGEWDRDHVRDHAEAAAHAHLRRAAALAFEVYRAHPFNHLILASPTELAPAVERELHAYLRDRIAARLTVATSAGTDEIRRAATEVEAGVERAAQAELVARLLERAGAGNGAVAGLEATLATLSDRRVETLVVSDGFEAPGWECAACTHLAARGPACPSCAEPMSALGDVVEAAVELALAQSAQVVTCLADADLDVHGRIGALLRF